MSLNRSPFELLPGVGLGPLRLGGARAENRAAMYAAMGMECWSRSGGAMDHYFDDAMQLEYGEDDRCDFIGASSHRALLILFDGLDVFDTEARALFALMASREPDPARHPYNADQYVFPTTGLTLWGAGSQADAAGRKRTVFEQVGVGSERYLEELERIRSGA